MSQDAKDELLPVLAVGVDAALLAAVGVAGEGFTVIERPADSERLMEDLPVPPAFAVCGAPADPAAIPEMAQVLRMQCPEAPIYLVVGPGTQLDRKTLVKNGFDDVFFLPLDRAVMTETIGDLITRIKRRGRLYRPVRVVDLDAKTVLDFDTYVYLPVNDKHVCYSAAGSPMDEKRLEKLNQHKLNSLFVSEEDMPRFYAYTAEVLRALGKNDAISDTERRQKLQGAVRDLISGLFTDTATGTDGGRKVVEDCQKIVKAYVVSEDGGGGWYQRFMNAAGTGVDAYSHASNVSTYAALFAIGLGFKTVEDIALAGLLHDIGLSRVPDEILAKPATEWTAEERAAYERHSEGTVEMIRERKLVVSDLVTKMILQHHERFNGTGFPKQLAGARILPETQLLALADRFVDLLEVRPGQPRMSPREAIAQIQGESARDPGAAFMDPDLLKRVLALFPAPAAEAAGEAA